MHFFIFIVSSFLVAVRDVTSEILFKGDFKISPTALLFFSLVITEIIALAVLKIKKESIVPRTAKKETFFASLFTFISFFLYFLPLNTSLGAGLNSTVVTGLDSLMTVLASFVILKIRPKTIPYMSYFISFIGLGIVGYHKLHYSTQTDWAYGLSLALLSSFFFGFFIVYSKVLLEKGVSANQLIFYRFFPCLIFMAPFAVPELSHLPIPKLINLTGYAIFLFAFPVFLFIHALKKLDVEKVALFFLLNPIFCLAVDWGIHPDRFSWTELVGIIVIFVGVATAKLLP